MSDRPDGWRPVNAEEAQLYIEAHPGGGGDPDLIEECQSFLPRTRPA